MYRDPRGEIMCLPFIRILIGIKYRSFQSKFVAPVDGSDRFSGGIYYSYAIYFWGIAGNAAATVAAVISDQKRNAIIGMRNLSSSICLHQLLQALKSQSL